MKVAILQMQSVAGNVDANLAAIDAAAAEAAEGGAQLLIAPELATTGYGAGDAIRDLAEPADGPQVRRLGGTAARHGIAIVAGFAERAAGVIYNALAFVRQNAETTIYRKTNLYADYERELFTPGGICTSLADFGGVKLGFLICYDVEFPENARRLSTAGAEMILVPTALPQGPHARFIAASLVPVRAFENQVFVVYANHAGSDALFTYAGLSRAAAPDGSLLAAEESDEAALLFADIDPGAYDESRQANTYLRDLRQPD